MKRISFYTLLSMLLCIVAVSCSDNDDFNPFNEHTKGEFNPGSVVFRKSNDRMETVQTWSDIARDKHGRITGYGYTRETEGHSNENETRKCIIDYYTDHEGNNIIRSKTDVGFYRINENGVEEKYTQVVEERISTNRSGYIETISTTIDHFDNTTSKPVTTTSRQTFTYDGDLCTGSTYHDGDTHVTYKYSWNAYQLKKITIINKNLKENIVDYSTYDYTFDKKEYFRYSAEEILPFIQSGFPQIYASMGYFGKFTPYVLIGEVSGGSTDYGDGPRPKIEMKNTYNFDIYDSQKMTFNGVSNIYNTYSVTFCK